MMCSSGFVHFLLILREVLRLHRVVELPPQPPILHVRPGRREPRLCDFLAHQSSQPARELYPEDLQTLCLRHRLREKKAAGSSSVCPATQALEDHETLCATSQPTFRSRRGAAFKSFQGFPRCLVCDLTADASRAVAGSGKCDFLPPHGGFPDGRESRGRGRCCSGKRGMRRGLRVRWVGITLGECGGGWVQAQAGAGGPRERCGRRWVMMAAPDAFGRLGVR